MHTWQQIVRKPVGQRLAVEGGPEDGRTPYLPSSPLVTVARPRTFDLRPRKLKKSISPPLVLVCEAYKIRRSHPKPCRATCARSTQAARGEELLWLSWAARGGVAWRIIIIIVIIIVIMIISMFLQVVRRTYMYAKRFGACLCWHLVGASVVRAWCATNLPTKIIPVKIA